MNRILIITLILLVGLSIAISATDVPKENVSDVIKSHAFELIDDAGIVRCRIGVNKENSAVLRICDERGQYRLCLGVTKYGGLVDVYNTRGQCVARIMSAVEQHGVAAVFDEQGDKNSASMLLPIKVNEPTPDTDYLLHRTPTVFPHAYKPLPYPYGPGGDNRYH